MSFFICSDCKFRKERKEGFRIFVSCTDSEKQKGYTEIEYFHYSKCRNYEKE